MWIRQGEDNEKSKELRENNKAPTSYTSRKMSPFSINSCSLLLILLSGGGKEKKVTYLKARTEV